ncbi:MAG: HypC/HybG/HupF family hydrogenase formation chaperone [Acidobacteria bacterium]|nr:MAG: HypC/HybG/HupF family hydrogenase formation chaperone [Acidobacteriota bacterium]PIE90724.1 MAG: HypC/HybG/HupF family hydrogenase formation chaperone [Acidobacteriota bacterium]
MCLAVPLKIIEVRQEGDRTLGVVDLEGSSYSVDLSLIDHPAMNDYVLVHAGIAIEKLNVDEADTRLRLFDRLAEVYREELGTDVQLIAPVEDRERGQTHA